MFNSFNWCVRKDILLRQGREKQKETLKKGTKLPDLSTIDKTEHNTRQELAKELGWSTGKVAMADKVWKDATPEQQLWYSCLG